MCVRVIVLWDPMMMPLNLARLSLSQMCQLSGVCVPIIVSNVCHSSSVWINLRCVLFLSVNQSQISVFYSSCVWINLRHVLFMMCVNFSLKCVLFISVCAGSRYGYADEGETGQSEDLRMRIWKENYCCFSVSGILLHQYCFLHNISVIFVCKDSGNGTYVCSSHGSAHLKWKLGRCLASKSPVKANLALTKEDIERAFENVDDFFEFEHINTVNGQEAKDPGSFCADREWIIQECHHWLLDMPLNSAILSVNS